MLRRADIAIKHQTHVIHLPNREFLHIRIFTYLLDIQASADLGGNKDSLAPTARMVIA
jgi:hypothetical protein